VFTNPGWNVVLVLITCGIFGYFLFYRLMQRDRDHLRRRFELLDAANTLAWERALAQGLDEELRPAFVRIAGELATLRRLTTEFRDPLVWLLIALVAGTIGEVVGYIFIDQDTVTEGRAETAIETELAAIYARLGAALPGPNPELGKEPHNYVGRVVAAVLTCGLYVLWWTYDLQVEGNRRSAAVVVWEDALAASVAAPA